MAWDPSGSTPLDPACVSPSPFTRRHTDGFVSDCGISNETLFFTLQRQQVKIDRLRHEVETCRSQVKAAQEESAVVRECLVELGVLDNTKVLVELHRRRFAAACALYSWKGEAKLDQVLGVEEVATALGLSAGPSVVANAASASRTMREAAAEIQSRLMLMRVSRLYVVGGFDGVTPLRSVAQYSLTTGVWEAAPPMAEARQHSAAACLGGMVYVAGGWNGREAMNSVERFNPDVGRWTPLEPLPERREGACAAAVRGQLYVCGGRDGSNFASVFRYDPAVRRWWVLPSMLSKRTRPAAATLGPNIYICGGEVGARTLDTFECLETLAVPVTWTPLPSMLESRGGHVAGIIDTRLVVGGGWRDEQSLQSVEVFDFHLGAWSYMAPMAVPRDGAAGVAASSRLYVFGGLEKFTSLNSAECWDPMLRTWLALPHMPCGRVNASAAVLLS